MKTTKITVWNRHMCESIIDAGSDVDVKCEVSGNLADLITKCVAAGGPVKLTLKGPTIDIVIHDVRSFQVEHVEK